ncbi:MAG: hypothetical protein M3Q70_00640 [bacterium]|nr:hypothetical protein [bacterium]
MSPEGSLSFEPEFELRLFDNPGFRLLFDTCSEVYTANDGGSFDTTAKEALVMLSQARQAVSAQYGIRGDRLDQLERVAGRYALTLPTELLNEALA